jgi:hypothetical protein
MTSFLCGGLIQSALQSANGACRLAHREILSRRSQQEVGDLGIDFEF